MRIFGLALVLFVALVAPVAAQGQLQLSDESSVVAPSEVPSHSLVKVSETVEADWYDLVVMAVIKNRLVFVDNYELKYPVGQAKVTWVFTGPDGNYSVRLACWDKEQGKVKESVAYITIGTPDDPPDDPDDPDDPPDPPASFSELLELIPEWSELVSTENRAEEGDVIATSFIKYAALVGDYDNLTDFTKATSTEYRAVLGLNRYLLWLPVMKKVEGKIREYVESGAIVFDNPTSKEAAKWKELWTVLGKAFQDVKDAPVPVTPDDEDGQPGEPAGEVSDA